MANQIKYIILFLSLSSCSLFIPPDDVEFHGKAAEEFVQEMQKK